MKKLLIRFFLSLLVILVAGYSQLHARTARVYQNCGCNVTKRSSVAFYYSSADSSQSDATYILNASSIGLANCRIELTENKIEEDEFSSSKKYSDSNSFLKLFNNQFTSHFFRHLEKSLTFSERLSFPYSYQFLYLILGVIRI
jgi:hypothetical protein